MIGTGNDQRVVPRFAPGTRFKRRKWPRSGGRPGRELRSRARSPPRPRTCPVRRGPYRGRSVAGTWRPRCARRAWH